MDQNRHPQVAGFDDGECQHQAARERKHHLSEIAMVKREQKRRAENCRCIAKLTQSA